MRNKWQSYEIRNRIKYYRGNGRKVMRRVEKEQSIASLAISRLVVFFLWFRSFCSEGELAGPCSLSTCS